MTILNDTVLESNKYLKINFDGGDLSSDAGLLLIKEFACKLGFVKILQSIFKTNDTASFRYHKDDENLWQMIYQILGAYFEDGCADELTSDPVLTQRRKVNFIFYLLKDEKAYISGFPTCYWKCGLFIHMP